MRSRWLLWAWPCYCREFLQSDLGDVSPLPKLPPLPKSPPLPLVSHHRLIVHNGCDKEDVWIGHMAGTTTGPDPQNVKIPPGGSYNFTTPDGQTSTRYWPKFGCDADGNRCVIGDSGGPQQICRSDGCSPPVDTKFEATFGISGLPCSPLEGMREGCDWVDISLVDGYTVPFKFEIHGSCWDADGHLMNASAKSVDCSRLSVDDCPKDETFHTFDSAGNATVDLQVRHPAASTAAGCYSPCSKLTLNQWASFSTTQYNMDVFSREYCCPTPPVSPAACRAGSVKWSKSVPSTTCVQESMGIPTMMAWAWSLAEQHQPTSLQSGALRPVRQQVLRFRKPILRNIIRFTICLGRMWKRPYGKDRSLVQARKSRVPQSRSFRGKERISQSPKSCQSCQRRKRRSLHRRRPQRRRCSRKALLSKTCRS